MALFDAIEGFLGRPDPMQQLYAGLGQAPGQPGSPAGAQPGQAAPGGPPQGGGPPGGSQGGPQVYQSPPDLASAYAALSGGGQANAPPANAPPLDMAQTLLALSQRDQARQGFNNGLALIAASAYPGRTSPALMKAMQGPQGEDPSSLFNSYVQMQAWQQQNTRYADLLNNSDKYAKSFGVDPDMFKATVTAAGPQGAGQILGQIAAAQMGLTGTQTDKEYKQAMRTWGQTPDSQDTQGNPLPKPTEAAWDQMQRDTVTLSTGQAKDVREARGALPGYNASLGDMNARIGRIQGQSDVISGILSDGKKQAAAQTLLSADPGSWGGIIAQHSGLLSDAELKAIGDLKQLKMQNYAANFKSGQRLTGQEANRLGQAADQIANLSVAPSDYMSNLGDVKKKLNAAQANAYGAAEDYDNLPMNLRPSLDPSYLPGGVNTRKETVAPTWAKPVDVSDPKDLASLQQGQAYRIKSGPYAGIHYKGFRDDGTPDGTSQ
jgi:hypothetical protein